MGENNTVTIPTEEYRNLLEIQVRASILKDYTTAENYSVSRSTIPLGMAWTGSRCR